MAARGRATAASLFLWVAATASLLVTAAAARPGAATGECTSALVSLSPCVDYMSGNASALVSLSPCVDYISGNEAAALGRCCSQLRSLAQSRPRCLCSALGVDRTRRLDLPAACNVQARRGCSGHRPTPKRAGSGGLSASRGASLRRPTWWL